MPLLGIRHCGFCSHYGLGISHSLQKMRRSDDTPLHRGLSEIGLSQPKAKGHSGRRVGFGRNCAFIFFDENSGLMQAETESIIRVGEQSKRVREESERVRAKGAVG